MLKRREGGKLSLRWLFQLDNGDPKVVVADTRDEAYSLVGGEAKLLDSNLLHEGWTWPVNSVGVDWEWTIPVPPESIEDWLWRQSDGVTYPVSHYIEEVR